MKSFYTSSLSLLVLIFCLAFTVQPNSAQATLGTGTLARAMIGANANDKIGNGGIHILPNGNIVIVSINWGNQRGAVTCLQPKEYQAGNIVINETNSLVGNIDNTVTANPDKVGLGSIIILTNGNYVVLSTNWTNNNTAAGVGAVTWVNGTTCLPANSATRGAVVSASNSLIGTSLFDALGSKVIALANGNYAVGFPSWSNGASADVGAVIWGNGATGTTGVISPSNAFIGSTAGDALGANLVALTNGNYVQGSGVFDNGIIANAGAATWFNGTNGFAVGASSVAGTATLANSLVGVTANDNVSSLGTGITALTNGNYVVVSPNWDHTATVDAGAATWGNGTSGTVGLITAANSLIGSAAGNNVGNAGAEALTNGNYVIRSFNWDNGAATNAGAMTWGNGTTGTVGTVSAANSIVGTVSAQTVGAGNFFALPNGHYVMNTFNWDNGGVSNVGASTWGNGNGGTVGAVSAANSLIGSSTDDRVGVAMIILTNGHYVLINTQWDNGGTGNVGAITWANGNGGTVGVVGASNSIIGSTLGDGLIAEALTNGHYVVYSAAWDNGATADVGIVRWVNGTTGATGVISSSDSVTGSTTLDGSNLSIEPLANGNYVIRMQSWDNGTIVNAGAIRWGNGNGGTVGTINATNALIGSSANDSIRHVLVLPNGNYVVGGETWDNGAIANAGFVLLADGTNGTTGSIHAANAFVGARTDDRIGTDALSLDAIGLSNGNFAFISGVWSSATTAEVGAVTWGYQLGGNYGVVSEENSMVFTQTDDLALSNLIALPNGDFLLSAPLFQNGATADVGLVMYFSGANSLTLNNGFELAGTNAKKSHHWELVNPKGSDKRLCNTIANPFGSFEGACYLQFSASASAVPTKPRSIKQIVTPNGWGNSGDVLKLTAMVSGANLKGKGKLDLTVFYTDGTNTKSSIAIPAGTYAYQKIALGAVISKPVQHVQVVVSAGKTTGKLKVDAVVLNVAVNSFVVRQLPTTSVRDGALALPEPTVPDGFRR